MNKKLNSANRFLKVLIIKRKLKTKGKRLHEILGQKINNLYYKILCYDKVS